MKGNFGMGPNFSRIASGATEHVQIVKCSSLPKILTKLIELNVEVIGLSEHATDTNLNIKDAKATCLVLGAEDEGMSNAVSRVVEKTIALKPLGRIKSLNVSVAAAVAMEKIFS
jgi:23S rRNA (guanosine2251-2'-O)-methyltransferase